MRLPAMFVCLSVCQQDYSKTHAWISMTFCVSGHGRTDQLLSPIRIIVRMLEPDCFLPQHMPCNAEFYYVRKICIGRLSQQQCVILRRQNTVVRGKCTLPKALLVISYFGFGFTSAYNSILFCCLQRNVEPCCHTHDSCLCDCVQRETALGQSCTAHTSASIALGRPIPAVNKKPDAKCKIQTTVQQLLIARRDNR